MKYEFSYSCKIGEQRIICAANEAELDEPMTRNEFEKMLISWLKEKYPDRTDVKLARFESIRHYNKSANDGKPVIETPNLLDETTIKNIEADNKAYGEMVKGQLGLAADINVHLWAVLADRDVLIAQNNELKAQLESAIVPPWKIGDTVWEIDTAYCKEVDDVDTACPNENQPNIMCPCKFTIKEICVNEISCEITDTWTNDKPEIEFKINDYLSEDDVYLTKEDAEKALERIC